MKSFAAKLLGDSGAAPIKALLGGLDKLFTSKEEKLQWEAVREKLQSEAAQAQINVNMAEARHRSVFVAGWRPFIGWICGAAMAQHFILSPWMRTMGVDLAVLDWGQMAPVVVGMLGIGGMRTYEKRKRLTK